MARRHYLDGIITKPRQVNVLMSQGLSVADTIRSIGVTEVMDCFGEVLVKGRMARCRSGKSGLTGGIT